MHRRKLKTMKDWEREANGNCQYSWYDYAKPGDLVDEKRIHIFYGCHNTKNIQRWILAGGCAIQQSDGR